MSPRRLDSWKEIAAYLGRDVTTVRRWERREGLPVHRHQHEKLGSVYAYSGEIDAWSQRRSTELPPPDSPVEARIESAPHAANGRAGFTMLAVLAVLVALTSAPWTPPVWAGRERVVRVALPAPEGAVVDSLAMSPDGLHVAFAAVERGGGSRLWVRRLDSATPQPLDGTDGAAFPFWSPDGLNLGFFAEGRLKRIAISTREVRQVAVAPDGRGGAWSDRGVIVYAPNQGAPLFRVPAAGGPASPVTRLGASLKEGHAWPEFLPDGRHLLYTDDTTDSTRYGIHVVDVETGVTRRLLPIYSNASYSTEGFLLYVDGSLMAQSFDPASLRVTGTPTALADSVLQRHGLAQKADFSVSRTGLVVVRSADEDQNRLVWIDRSGREVGALGVPAFYSNPTLSPDGRSLAVTASDDTSQTNLWLFDVPGGESSRLTLGTVDYAPVWSSDGAELIFASIRLKRGGVYRRRVGGGADEPVLAATRMQIPESWSPDGRYLTFQTYQQEGRFDVWAWQLDGEPHAFPVLDSPANEGHSRISPDGRFLAYASDESGRFEVYVRSFPAGTEQWQISTGGGADPRWRSDGRELYYVGMDRRMMAVGVTTRPAFRRGALTPLFDTRLADLWQDTRNHYDVTPDGRRFILLSPVSDRRVAPFTLLVNWTTGGS